MMTKRFRDNVPMITLVKAPFCNSCFHILWKHPRPSPWTFPKPENTKIKTHMMGKKTTWLTSNHTEPSFTCLTLISARLALGSLRRYRTKILKCGFSAWKGVILYLSHNSNGDWRDTWTERWKSKSMHVFHIIIRVMATCRQCKKNITAVESKDMWSMATCRQSK